MPCAHDLQPHPAEIYPCCAACGTLMSHIRLSETVYLKVQDYPPGFNPLVDGLLPPGVFTAKPVLACVHACGDCGGAGCGHCNRAKNGRWPEIQGKRLYEKDACPVCVAPAKPEDRAPQ